MGNSESEPVVLACVLLCLLFAASSPWRGAEEVAKLQKHLALLRQEYVKMQQKLADTERRCAVLAAQTAGPGPSSSAAADTFVSRLLDFVANIYQQEHYRWWSWLERWAIVFILPLHILYFNIRSHFDWVFPASVKMWSILFDTVFLLTVLLLFLVIWK